MIGIMLVRNEQGRYLEKVLEQYRKVCRQLIVLDDASTDDTAQICTDYGAEVYKSLTSWWGTDELLLRRFLWGEAQDAAKEDEWILCLDADETLTNIDRLPEAIRQAENIGADGLAFRLYDMWDAEHYREDEYWTAHNREWVMCVRYDPNKRYVWRETPLHCGRFPLNAADNPVLVEGIKIQHWGWSREADRIKKYERYMEADPNGNSGSLAQYRSILDASPILRRFEE